MMMPGQRLALRVTFVIDREGKIRYIEQGGPAIDTSGAMTACSRLEHERAAGKK
jgi:peroxiredoxin